MDFYENVKPDIVHAVLMASHNHLHFRNAHSDASLFFFFCGFFRKKKGEDFSQSPDLGIGASDDFIHSLQNRADAVCSVSRAMPKLPAGKSVRPGYCILPHNILI